jgi:hypothetical protein
MTKELGSQPCYPGHKRWMVDITKIKVIAAGYKIQFIMMIAVPGEKGQMNDDFQKSKAGDEIPVMLIPFLS